ncbi:hypothetical protein DPX39_110025700 [Trypanosoma brucei equiperdum]|uniref:RNase III domain-containing protein n=1 Tax=Trypanosoma brucei equiperdum TaxID=630700 RepID=A0A3L6KVU6_9TRYP|nr:hypothetical protein DPX39_110025700 [Trypanosoma brucei equiperdum]
MKRTRNALLSSELLCKVMKITEEPRVVKELSDILLFPRIKINSLPFVPPPKWTTELNRRLQKRFPELSRKRHILFTRAFIHPSFTAPEAASSTMNASIGLGESLLLSVGGRLVVSIFDDLRRDEVISLVSFLSSDAALSHLLRHHWELEDMVLTDASVQLFQPKATPSASNIVSWLPDQRGKQVPDQYCAGAVKAVIGAVFLDGGLSLATQFIFQHVLEALE